MRGGVRVAAFFLTSRTALSRASRDSRPTAWSREVAKRSRTQAAPRQHAMADQVHDREPGDTGVQLHAREPEREQDSVAPRSDANAGEPVADEAAENSARACGQYALGEMQRREPAARRKRQRRGR